jgi:hypothetical protein
MYMCIESEVVDLVSYFAAYIHMIAYNTSNNVYIDWIDFLYSFKAYLLSHMFSDPHFENKTGNTENVSYPYHTLPSHLPSIISLTFAQAA